jgi:hypothetical protein
MVRVLCYRILNIPCHKPNRMGLWLGIFRLKANCIVATINSRSFMA